MKRLAFVLLAAAALAPAALAKGPSAATITGRGLVHALSVKGTESSGLLGDLTTYTGFFPASFGQEPSPLLARRPANVGPRYTIHYVVPGDKIYRLTQDLYPYALGGAVTYMKPDQPIFGMGSRGGWYRGGVDLKRTLVRAGLPRTNPVPRASAKKAGGDSSALLLGIGIPGVVLLTGAAVLVARRRSSG
jgi:hypothetical protein